MWLVTMKKTDGTVESQPFKDEAAALYLKGMVETNMQGEHPKYTSVIAEELITCIWQPAAECKPEPNKRVPGVYKTIPDMGTYKLGVVWIDDNQKWRSDAGYEIPTENVIYWLEIPDSESE